MAKLHILCAAMLPMLGIGAANAQGWASAHPRRAEVDGRLANQDRRIAQGVQKGQLSAGQAAALRSSDSAIRAQEQADAAAHGGHITAAEKHSLNQEENASSRAIHRTRH